MILFDSSFAGQKKIMPFLPCLSLRTFFWPPHFTFWQLCPSTLILKVMREKTTANHATYFDSQRHIHPPTHPTKKTRPVKKTHTNYLDSHMKSTHPTKTHVSSRGMLMLEIVNSKRCGRRPELDPAVATMARPPPITAPTGPATGGVAIF